GAGRVGACAAGGGLGRRSPVVRSRARRSPLGGARCRSGRGGALGTAPRLLGIQTSERRAGGDPGSLGLPRERDPRRDRAAPAPARAAHVDIRPAERGLPRCLRRAAPPFPCPPPMPPRLPCAR